MKLPNVQCTMQWGTRLMSGVQSPMLGLTGCNSM